MAVRSIALAVLVLLIPVHGAAAQRAPVRFGVLAGVTRSSITDIDGDFAAELGEVPLRSRSRTGVQAGVSATIPVNGRLLFQPELHYVQKGGGTEFAFPFDPNPLALYVSNRLTVSLRTAYVELPLLARVNVVDGAWRVYVVGGPSVALRVSCTARTVIGPFKASAGCSNSTELPGNVPTTDDLDDPVRRTDLSVVAGAAVERSVRGHAMSLQLRPSFGVQSIIRDNPPGLSPKNRGLSFLLGVTL